MALLTALSRNDLLNHLMQVVPGDTIQLAADLVVDEFLVPKNIAASVANPVTVRSANISRPAILRGICAGNVELKGNFGHLGSAPQATSVAGLALESLVIAAREFTSCKDENGVTRSLVMPDGRGLGWRVSGTAHPAAPYASYSENGGMFGIKLGSGTRGFRGKNLIFRGFAGAFSVSSAKDTILRWCGFYENAEDYMKFGGFDGLTLEWCEGRDARSPKAAMAAHQGWGGSEDVHQDFFQQIGRGDNLTIRYNYLYNDDYRVHFALIRHSKLSSGYTPNVTIENNEGRQSHPTGMLVSSCDGLIMRRNKITGVGTLSGGGPVIQVGAMGTEQANKGTLVLQDNEATRIYGQLSPGSNGNAKNNNPSHYPSGFQNLLKEQVAAGQPYVGPYGGDTDVVVLPTKPPALADPTDAVLAADPVQDPALDPADPRRTGVIRIRKHGLAGNASEVRWKADDDTASRATVEIEGDATHRCFRMFSNNQSHLLYPGDAAKSFKVLYVDPAISSTARSDLSSFSLSFSVAVAPGAPVWLPTNTIDFRRAKGFYTKVGGTLREIGVGAAHWHKPAPVIAGSGFANSLTAIPQPNSPTSYAAGAFLLAGAYRSSTGAFVVPTTVGQAGGVPDLLWAEILALSGSNNQAFSLLASVAPAPAAALGAFTAGSGRCFSVAFARVDLAAPVADIQSSYGGGGGATITIPALTLPAASDNYRGVIIACNAAGQAMTPPDGYRLVGQHGGSPRVAVYESIEPIAAFPATTVAMAASSQCLGVSLALRLVADL